MGHLKYIFQIIFVLAFTLVGCTETEFSQRPPRLVEQEVNSGQVDILFVVDNSGSMYTEQVKMAQAFPQLVNGMDISQLDYRIGIVTTDIISSQSPKKDWLGLGQGALQNGRLIRFPNGELYLNNQSTNIEGNFSQTIKRQETFECDRSGYQNCPSSDERGIYTALKAVRRNEGGFFRSGSHIAFVFLSDEDVRGEGLNNVQKCQNSSFPGGSQLYCDILPTYGDYPTSLIEYVRSSLGESHTMSAHSIVTNNSSCLAQQNNQGQNILGHIGQFYMNMTNPNTASMINSGQTLSSISAGKLLNGTIGSICSSNYTSEVGNIKNALDQASYKYVSSKDLECTILEDTFELEHCPSGHTCRLASSQDKVLFQPALAPSDEARFSYLCP